MKGSATIPSERHEACEKSVAIRSLPFRAPSSGWGGTPLALRDHSDLRILLRALVLSEGQDAVEPILRTAIDWES